jgi:hypothetical protein
LNSSASISMMVVAYLLLIELGKYWFYRSYHASAAPRPVPAAAACIAVPPGSPPTIACGGKMHAAEPKGPVTGDLSP